MSVCVFVYGTLRKEGVNHRFLNGAEFCGFYDLEGYEMFNVGAFPCAVPGNGRIKGEVYECGSATLAKLDLLEGYYGKGKVNLYNRVKVPRFSTREGKPCLIYLWGGDLDTFDKIESGDWIDYAKTHE